MQPSLRKQDILTLVATLFLSALASGALPILMPNNESTALLLFLAILVIADRLISLLPTFHIDLVTWRTTCSLKCFKNSGFLHLIAPSLLTIITLYIHAITITHSSYFLWPDEGPAYHTAREIAEGVRLNYFWGLGVFNEHPSLGSAVPAMFMYFTGTNLFNYRFCIVLAVLVGGLLIFDILRKRYSNMTASVGLIAFLAPYYHFQFLHIGYINHWLSVGLILSFWFWHQLTSHPNYSNSFRFGVISGFSCYFTYQGFLIPFVAFLAMCVLLATKGRTPLTAPLLATFIGGVVASTAPLFASLDVHIAKISMEHLGLGAGPGGHVADFNFCQAVAELFGGILTSTDFLWRSLSALLAPTLLHGSSHHLNGAFYDGLSAVLFPICLAIALYRAIIKKDSLIIYVLLTHICFSISCGLPPYATVPPTRTCFLMATFPILLSLTTISMPKLTSITVGLTITITMISLNIWKIHGHFKFNQERFYSDIKLWIELAADRARPTLVVLPKGYQAAFDEFTLMYAIPARSIFGVTEDRILPWIAMFNAEARSITRLAIHARCTDGQQSRMTNAKKFFGQYTTSEVLWNFDGPVAYFLAEATGRRPETSEEPLPTEVPRQLHNS